MNELNTLSDFNDITFEDLSNVNGCKYWWASDLMKILDYPNIKSFNQVINRAVKAMMNLNIDHFENIQQDNNNGEYDYKLSRFACYLISMNADPKKPAVARAQFYFAEMTRKFELVIQHQEDVERLTIREEIKDGNKSLDSIAKRAGVEDYAKFTNQGYLGLYNMYNWQLAKKRGINKTNLLDFMGRTELAANLFRIVLTEEKIKSQNIEGQSNQEKAHYDVGRTIRKQVQENAGKNPEDLPKADKLPDIRKALKSSYHKMLKEDKTGD